MFKLPGAAREAVALLRSDRSLRDCQGISFAYGRRRLLSLHAVNYDQDLVCSWSGVAAERAIIGHHLQSMLTLHVAQQLRYVCCSPLHSPIGPQNHDSSTVIRSVFPSRSIVKFVARGCEHSHIYRFALLEEKFPFLIAFITRDNSQRFVPRDRRISSHGLIVYEYSSIHSAARDQILQQVRNIRLAISPAVLSARDSPATSSFILR